MQQPQLSQAIPLPSKPENIPPALDSKPVVPQQLEPEQINQLVQEEQVGEIPQKQIVKDFFEGITYPVIESPK